MSMEMSNLSGVRFEAALDPVKTDLEMRCVHCDAHLCDVEHGDELTSLAGVALEHSCEPNRGDYFRLTRIAANLWAAEVVARREGPSPFTDEYMRGIADMARAVVPDVDHEEAVEYVLELVLRGLTTA